MRSIRRRGWLGLTVTVAMLLVLWGGVAAAQTTNDTTYPTVSAPPMTDPCTTATSGVCGTAGTVVSVGRAHAGSPLFTGGDLALLTVLGIAVLGSGVWIVALSRRRSTSARA